MRDLILGAFLALSPAEMTPAEVFFAPNAVLAHDGEVDADNCHPGRQRGRMHCHPVDQITTLVTE